MTPMLEGAGAPGQSHQRPLLERSDLKPQERRRIGRAVVVLLGWGLVATAILGLLALWHLVRRGRVLRASQPPPRLVGLPEDDPGPRDH